METSERSGEQHTRCAESDITLICLRYKHRPQVKRDPLHSAADNPQMCLWKTSGLLNNRINRIYPARNLTAACVCVCVCVCVCTCNTTSSKGKEVTHTHRLTVHVHKHRSNTHTCNSVFSVTFV